MPAESRPTVAATRLHCTSSLGLLVFWVGPSPCCEEGLHSGGQAIGILSASGWSLVDLWWYGSEVKYAASEGLEYLTNAWGLSGCCRRIETTAW
eukprot:scaffold7740_cov61-Cylindrotheca_fusiformis.AAC.1